MRAVAKDKVRANNPRLGYEKGKVGDDVGASSKFRAWDARRASARDNIGRLPKFEARM